MALDVTVFVPPALLVALLGAAFMAGLSVPRQPRKKHDAHDIETGTLVTVDAAPDKSPASSDTELARAVFFTFTTLIIDEIPPLLRMLFKRRWDMAYAGVMPPWSDSQEDGDALWNGEFDRDKWYDVEVTKGNNVVNIVRVCSEGSTTVKPGDKVRIAQDIFKVMSVKGDKVYLNDEVVYTSGILPLTGQVVPHERQADPRMLRAFREQVLLGDRSEWDISLLCFCLCSSSHSLLSGEEEMRARVMALRELRNNSLAHVKSCRMTPADLVKAVGVMDAFVAKCMPDQWQHWHGTSRKVLQQYSTQLPQCLRATRDFMPPSAQIQCLNGSSLRPPPQQLQFTPDGGEPQSPPGPHAQAMRTAASQPGRLFATTQNIVRQQELVCQRFWRRELVEID